MHDLLILCDKRGNVRIMNNEEHCETLDEVEKE
jgi:hypothetical protein